MTMIKAVLMYKTCVSFLLVGGSITLSLSLLKLSMNNLVRLTDTKGRLQVSTTSILMEVGHSDLSVFFAI